MNKEFLDNLLRYDPEVGAFTWLNGPRKGRVAGTRRPDGYIQINIGGSLYLVHRLAYLTMTGDWPIQIDHINSRRSDNSWENLRNATHSQNKMHTPIQINNSTGCKGVKYDDRRDKYMANIKRDNVSYFLGYFETKEEAYQAYIEAATQLHGEFMHA